MPPNGSSASSRLDELPGIDAANCLQRLQLKFLESAVHFFRARAINVRRAGYMHLWSRETATDPKENA